MDTSSEREEIAKYLDRRADWWQQWRAFGWVARALKNEAHAIRKGRHLEKET